MNRTHRIVWNAVRGAYIVTHERTAARGKPSTSRRLAASAAVTALLACAAGPALATDCATSVSTSVSGSCSVADGSSLDVSSTGTLTSAVQSGTVLISGAAVSAGDISNAGIISNTRSSGGRGIAVSDDGTISGTINNSGTISAYGHAIEIGNNSGGTIDGGSGDAIVNSGLISASAVASVWGDESGIRINSAASYTTSITGNVSNSGTITGAAYGINVNSETGGHTTLSGSIVNTGTITGGSAAIRVAGSGTLIDGGITSSGTLTGGSSGAIVIDSGTVTSANYDGTVLLDGGTVNGDIVNTGTISDTNNVNGGRGIEIVGNAVINGTINNSGTISAYGHAIEIGNNGAGTINAGSGDAIVNSGLLSVSTVGSGWGDESGIRINSSASTTTSITGSVVNNGTISSAGYGINVTAETGGTTTMTGDIANSGTISSVNRGIEINGTNGNTTVTGNITNSGTISVSASSAAAIEVAGSNALLDGGISNSGTISSSGDYGVRIYQASVSGTIANSGTISGNAAISVDAGSVGGDITNSGTLTGGTLGGIAATNAATITGNIVNTGSIAAQGHGIALTSGSSVTGNIVNSGTISGGSNGYGISIGNGSALSGSLINSGTIAGGLGAIDDASNTLSSIIISGNDTAKFVGDVVASAAQVRVAPSAVYTLDDGNRFDVAGFTNAGTLKLGSTSSATVSGDFTNTGTLKLGVASASTYGKLVVGGTATLGGALFIDVSNSNTLANNDILTGIISTTGGVSGTFASVSDNSSLFRFIAAYTDKLVNLDVIPESAVGAYSAVSAEKNAPAYNAARALDQIFATNPTGAVSSAFYSITGGNDAISNAVSQTLPLISTGLSDVKQDSLRSINRIVQARIESNRGMSAGDEAAIDKYFWVKPFGSWADQGTVDGVAGYKAQTAGVVAGVDAELAGPWRVGAAFAYARSDINGKSSVAPQSADVDLYQLTGYGSYSLDEQTEINFQAALGQVNNSTRRAISLTSTVAKAQYDSTTAQFGVGIGHTLPLGAHTTFTPSLRADYIWIKDQGYSESGAGALDLNVKQRTSDSFVVGIDGKLMHEIDKNLQLQANLGGGYDLINDRSSIISAYAGAPTLSFTTYGSDPSPWLARGGLGVVYKFKDDLELTARYDAEYRESFLNQTASIKVRWAF